jgi:hypothetical protein
LPVDHHNTFLGIDRKYRLGFRIEDAKLSEAEIKALLFAAEHYPANPI